MASFRYLRNLSDDDMTPDAPKEYTRAERWANWWDYNLKWVVGGIVCAAIIIYLLVDILIFGDKADFQVSVVGNEILYDSDLDIVREALAPYATDENDDGVSYIQVYSYYSPFDEETLADTTLAYELMAGQTQLAGDISIASTNIFIINDPEGFQNYTQMLCYVDGTYPDDPTTANWEEMVYLLADCPALAELAEEFEGYYIARRSGTSDAVLESFAANDSLWNTLTEGAIPYTESSSYEISQ